jgi:hypothetical protein
MNAELEGVGRDARLHAASVRRERTRFNSSFESTTREASDALQQFAG